MRLLVLGGTQEQKELIAKTIDTYLEAKGVTKHEQSGQSGGAPKKL